MLLLITFLKTKFTKVILLQVSVILSTGGCLWPHPGGEVGESAAMATFADGTHPTGMHSCFKMIWPASARSIWNLVLQSDLWLYELY